MINNKDFGNSCAKGRIYNVYEGGSFEGIYPEGYNRIGQEFDYNSKKERWVELNLKEQEIRYKDMDARNNYIVMGW